MSEPYPALLKLQTSRENLARWRGTDGQRYLSEGVFLASDKLGHC